MINQITSRERLLRALNYEETDHIPLAFMIFSGLRKRINRKLGFFDPVKLIRDQLELGIDTFVDLRFFTKENYEVGHSDAPGFPVSFEPSVQTHTWTELVDGERYPLLHKSYLTPEGELAVSAKISDDWPYGSLKNGDLTLPFMDDYLAPRCSKYLIEKKEDLKALTHLLKPPRIRELEVCRNDWKRGKRLAEKHNLLLAGGWGVGADALAWFCGLQNAVILSLEEPDFFAELLEIINQWNRSRMEAYLDFGVDLFIRRAWYEGTDFWSPELYRKYFFPIIREEVQLAHEAGAKYGYILTSGSMLLQDQLLELGIDVLIGADPVQGKGTDLTLMKNHLDGKMCIWGGINGFVTVETGTEEQIEQAVRNAIEKLGPDGLILSPVDNVSDPSDGVWKNVLCLIKAWKKYRN